MKREIKLHGKVKDEVIHFQDHDRIDFWNKARRLFEGKQIELVVRQKRNERTTAQNRYLWGVAYAILASWFTDFNGETYTTENIHQFCKERFLPIVSENEKKKMIGPSGEIYEIPHTTTKMSTKEFDDYKNYIQKFAAEIDIDIPDPNEDFEEKKGKINIDRAA